MIIVRKLIAQLKILKTKERNVSFVKLPDFCHSNFSRIGGWQFGQFSAVCLNDVERSRALIGWHSSR